MNQQFCARQPGRSVPAAGDEINLQIIVKLRQGSGKDRQGMALKAKGLKA